MRKLCVLMILSMLFASEIVAQSPIAMGGRVVADGAGIAGVTISVPDNILGLTDAQGNFLVNVPAGTDSLYFEHVSYRSMAIAVRAATDLVVNLESRSNVLEDVVVTGYGGQTSRKLLTSAISTVKSEEIANIPASSSDQLLQGRAAGVQVSSNSGTPGGGMFVRIRGTSSLNASSDPLYVIDGVPLQSNNLATMGLGGNTTNPMADINPADIESMEILKDASATAIYGARAANGVVLITTKKGGSGRAKISLGMYYGTQRLQKQIPVVDGPTFEMLMNEAAANNNRTQPYANPSAAHHSDWGSLIFQDGTLRNVDLSISGGTRDLKYMVSANNFLQEGVVRKSDFKRSTARVNLEYNPLRKLKMGTNILFSYNSRGRVRNDDNIAGAISSATFYPSNVPFYLDDGSYRKIPTFDHPEAILDNSHIKMLTNRFLGSVFAEYQILDNLTFRANFSVDQSDILESLYDDTKTNNGSAVNGSAQESSTRNTNWIQENVLTWRKNAGLHGIVALVGTTMQESQTNLVTAIGQGFPSDEFRKIGSAAVQRSSSAATSWGIASVFTRINYDFDNKYLVTLNVRRDGSSRFGATHQYGTFPSLGVGWVISDEKFMDNAGFFNLLKLRGSYGITGNQNGINDFQSLGLWGGAAYAGLPGISPVQPANPDLKWETTAQYSIGLDIRLFNNRLDITADRYIKDTRDLLLDVSVPRTTGFNFLTQNYGAITNKGFELGLSGDIFRGSGENGFNWTSALNISWNRNRITKLAAPFNVYNRDIFRYEEGGEMYSFFLHPQTGVDPRTGDIQFEDVNGDGVFDANNDRRIMGSANPDFAGGFTNTLNWGPFDLMAFLQFSYGNEQLNWSAFFMQHGGTRSTNFYSSQLDRWQQAGDITMVPRMATANYASNLRPSRFLEDGSYMRLKNISIGYRLPGSLLSKMRMSSARVYFSAQNLFTLTNYTGLDPEMTATASTGLTQGIEFFTMPQPLTLMGGINLSF